MQNALDNSSQTFLVGHILPYVLMWKMVVLELDVKDELHCTHSYGTKILSILSAFIYKYVCNLIYFGYGMYWQTLIRAYTIQFDPK